MNPKSYKDNFFEYHLQGALDSAEAIIPIILKYVNPASVIDVGCGIGAWLSKWKKSGIKNIDGIDGEYIDTSKLLIEQAEFKAKNLEKDFIFDKKYNIVTCLEVAEHLPAKCADNFIKSLCALSDVALFSAAIPGQGGTLHINEQYPEYWVAIFQKNGFVPIDCLRPQIWNNENIQWWYRQNILFFVKKEVLVNYPELNKLYDAKAKILSLVHPLLLKEKNEKVIYYEDLLSSPFQKLKHGVKRIFKSNN